MAESLGTGSAQHPAKVWSWVRVEVLFCIAHRFASQCVCITGRFNTWVILTDTRYFIFPKGRNVVCNTHDLRFDIFIYFYNKLEKNGLKKNKIKRLTRKMKENKFN